MRRVPAATPLSETIMKAPASPVRSMCVPPHSSTDSGSPFSAPETVSTRTISPYFSPNRAIAPVAMASATGISLAATGRSAMMARFTSRSTAASSSGVRAAMCEKSKRRRCGSTSEPACFTWVPSARRRAACSRWVQVWLRAVDLRWSASTLRVASPPLCSSPLVTSISCTSRVGAGLWVVSTRASPEVLASVPMSPAWPPPSP